MRMPCQTSVFLVKTYARAAEISAPVELQIPEQRTNSPQSREASKAPTAQKKPFCPPQVEHSAIQWHKQISLSVSASASTLVLGRRKIRSARGGRTPVGARPLRPRCCTARPEISRGRRACERGTSGRGSDLFACGFRVLTMAETVTSIAAVAATSAGRQCCCIADLIMSASRSA